MFLRKPVSEHFIAKRVKLFGVGINDATYATQPSIRGKPHTCPFYRAWANMICRCYNPKYYSSHTYDKCEVVEEWHRFSVFSTWMATQDWFGKQLDKDLMDPLNTVYGPDSCIFIPRQINTLILTCKGSRGEYPLGVSFHKASGKFSAALSIEGARNNLGTFDTPEEAAQAYRQAKHNHIAIIAQQQTDPRIRDGLMLHAVRFLNGEAE